MSPGTLDLRTTFLAVLDALAEAGSAYAFIGALPVLAWGRIRATADIDLVVAASADWERLAAALERRRFKLGRAVGPADPSDPLPDITVLYAPGQPAVRLDVFIAKTDFERAVVATAREAPVLETTVRLARPEASIIYKLLAQRPRDLEDVASIFEARAAAGDPLDWEFLDHWAAEWGIEDRLAPYRERAGPVVS